MRAPSSIETKSSWLRINFRRGWVAGVLLVFAVAIGVAWWSMLRTTPVQYVTAPVGRGAITRVVTATGTVNPVLTIVVGTYVSGIIQNLYCDYNTRVRAGQVCARIDPRPYQATLNQYSAQLLRDHAVLDKDRLDLARYQQLAAQNAIARQQAEDQVYIVNQDEATVKLDQALVEGAKLNLDYCEWLSESAQRWRSVIGGQDRFQIRRRV